MSEEPAVASEGRSTQRIRGSQDPESISTRWKPLYPDEVEERRKQYGLNTIASEKRIAWYMILLRALLHPFNVLLIIIAVCSGVADELSTSIIVLVMVFISTVIRFFQDWKSENAISSLLKLVTKSVTAVRYKDKDSKAAKQETVLTESLVPGDWVILHPGDLVPADCVILSSKVFFVSQAPLTGEAIPVEKHPIERKEGDEENVMDDENPQKAEERMRRYSDHQPMSKCTRFFRIIFGLKIETDTHLDQKGLVIKEDLSAADHVFMGCQVITGVATARVVRTGGETLFGRMAEALAKQEPVNPFQQGVRRISWCFFITMAVMIPPVLIAQGLIKEWDKSAFIFSLSVAVGLTPEMLPLIVNANLAKGSVKMTQKKSIIKKMDAIINLGAVDTLCTDKTGTLTKAEVELASHLNPYGIPSCVPLHIGFLNAHFQSLLQNPLDTAISSYFVGQVAVGANPNNDKMSIKSEVSKDDLDAFLKKYKRIDELPFDFERRRLSIFLQEDDGGKKLYLVCKGAVEETLAVCTRTISDGTKSKFLGAAFPPEGNVIPLNPTTITQTIMVEYEKLSNQGQKVLAVAYKPLPKEKTSVSYDDEADLIFVGFVTFIDPPKETAETAIAELIKHSIEVKVLTGDALNVCAAVCNKIKLPIKSVVTSEDVDNAVKNGTLSEVVEMGTIFAKLTPLQKSLVVHTLSYDNNHAVAFMGDGINDSAALKEADVGISVDNGVDICRESADVILLDKDLHAVVTGIRIGRETYGNTIKYIAMAVSSNFGNVFSVLVASAWLRFEPMQSLHLLTQNLLYDISQIGIPWDNMDEDFLMVPHKWRMRSIIIFMLWLGPWSSIFDISTFLFMVYWKNVPANSDEDSYGVKLFQTTWFTVGLLTQTLIVHMIRTPKIPIIQSRASWSLSLLTLLIMGAGLALPYVPWINDQLGFTYGLDADCYYFLAIVLALYCIAANIAKYFYLKCFHEWF